MPRREPSTHPSTRDERREGVAGQRVASSHRGVGGERRVVAADREVARVAARQYGNITSAQLRTCGLTPAAIRHRVATGRLHPRHRGVFAVGYRTDAPLAAECAALLAIGPGAALGHRSAAVLAELLPPLRGPVDVVVPAHVRRAHAGITVHRTGTLTARDVWTRKELRVTTPHRTLLDLAATAGADELRRAVDEAYARGLVRPGMLTIPPGMRGAARLRAVLEGRGVTRSGLERRFLALARRAGLPRPETNARVTGYEVDVLWREQRIAVELDTLGTHATRVLSDRDKDLALRAAGYTPLRFTDRQVDRMPERVVLALGASWHVGAHLAG